MKFKVVAVKSKEQNMNNVGFEEMIKLISDGELCGYYSTANKTYKFYAELAGGFAPDIKVHVDDMDLTIGEFFDEYEYLSDWINYKFVVKKAEFMKHEKWIPCDFTKACKIYDSGGMVRIEKEGGVLHHYSKTICEFKQCYVVMDFQLEGWEYNNE